MTNSVPRVAVLLAAYNGAAYIEEQLGSILSQLDVSVEIFISVDSSTDGTEAMVNKMALEDNRVNVLPHGEYFGGAARNFYRLIRDVDISSFDYVSFADQDDIWFADKLQRACALLQTGHCDVYSSNVTAFWPDGKKVLIDKAQSQKQFDHFFEAAGPGCTYVFNQHSALAFKRFLLEHDHRIEAVSLHDWLAYAFCRNHGFKWFIDPQPSMLYRQHDGNQVGTNAGFKAFRKRIEMVSKHWYRNQVDLILELVAPEKADDFNKYPYRVFNFYALRRRPRDAFFLLVMFALGVY